MTNEISVIFVDIFLYIASLFIFNFECNCSYVLIASLVFKLTLKWTLDTQTKTERQNIADNFFTGIADILS